MTFKDLRRLVQSQQEQSEPELQRLRDKPFWIWGFTEHKDKHKTHKGNCCFNHTIGLPKKDGIERPMFDYEGLLYDALLKPGLYNSKPATKGIAPDNIAHPFKLKHLWVKKATGLGVTELMLRFMTWLCLRDDNLKGTQMCIVTGPGIDRAIGLIDRIKKLFEPHDITFKTKETDIKLNGVTIRAYPADHLDSMRGLTDVSFILIDEADFFSKHEQKNARIFPRDISQSQTHIL